MKVLFSTCLLLLVSSCGSFKPFIKEKVCAPHAVSYITKSTGRSKSPPLTPMLRQKLEETKVSMQRCYENYMRRTGHKEFQTCMVVGIDHKGNTEFFNFSSQDIHSDRGFIQCAAKVTKRVPYSTFGKNYILVQSYNFY